MTTDQRHPTASARAREVLADHHLTAFSRARDVLAKSRINAMGMSHIPELVEAAYKTADREIDALIGAGLVIVDKDDTVTVRGKLRYRKRGEPLLVPEDFE